jgi:hypothetical protein
MNYYPYNTKESSMIINSNIPVKNTYNQLDLAPYLPQLSKDAHLLLAQVHMELANNIDGSSNTSVENMSNTNTNTNILDLAHQKVMEHFKSKNKKKKNKKTTQASEYEPTEAPTYETKP